MTYAVLLTAGAERDLAAIQGYLAGAEGEPAADRFLARVLEEGSRLARHPERGSYPKELLALGIRDYRQLVVKPHRLIYRVIGNRVYISVIADGRRDFQSLLARRLLAGD